MLALDRLLTTPGTPAHYTQAISGAKKLLVAVAQSVTTGLGALSCDVVLVSLSESALTEAGNASAQARCTVSSRRSRERPVLTSALGNRGPPSNEIYWFKSKGDGSIIKVAVTNDSNAPYLQRRLETNLSKLQSNLKVITENSRYAATAKTLFHAKFVDAPFTWAVRGPITWRPR